MKKRILALLLSMTLVLTTGTLTFAEDSAENISTEQSSGNTSSQRVTEGQNTTTVENVKNSENGMSSSTNSINPEQQVRAVSTENTIGPQVGDTVWIKSGSKIYKSTEGKDEYTVWFQHEIKIKNIIYDGNGKPEWYEFEVQDWATGFLKNYSYIKVDDTFASEDEDTDSKECNCENPPENLAEHADSCPRKQYVKRLITNENGQYKTAKTIYADWKNYDEATQTDILNMLEAYVKTTYDELMEMVKGFRFENFEGKLENGVNVTVYAGMDAFPEGTTMRVSKASVQKSEIQNLVSENAEILKIVAADIDFGCQPKNSVSVSIDIPDKEMPKNANMYYVIHMATQGPEFVTSAYLNSAGKGQTIPFTAESFSTYVVVLVNNKYQAELMRDVLKNDIQYTVKTLKANLFDYDAAKLNTELVKAGGGNKGFVFPEVTNSLKVDNIGINLGGSTAKQGILETTLQKGFPVFKYLDGNGGEETGKILFDPETTVNGKDIYENVDFEFIYDNTNGYYTYNSAWNHAQLNDSKDRVELYADTLSMTNEFVAVANLSQYSNPNQMENINKETNRFKSTIHTTNEIDPFVCFSISETNASEVQNIRVRAKITKKGESSFDSNFTIYFSKTDSTYQEGQTISAKYTSNGEWIDFVFDTTTCENWSGKINGIRLDPIQDNEDSLKNSTFEFEVAWVQLDSKETTTDYRYGGYYPFSDIRDSVPGRADQFNLDMWKAAVQEDSKGRAFASRAIFNTDADGTRQDHLAFGTVLEQDFYIPVSGKTDFGNDIVFEFTGDDDLWVFVDDQLVLDIGGGHTPVTGSINFTEGTNYVNNAVQVTGYDSPTDENTQKQQNGTLEAALCAPGMHTLKIFYMERHSGVSNCLMKFNLPLVPSGAVEVSKSVQDQNDTAINTLNDVAFTFEISGTLQNSTGESLNFANLSYTVFDTATGTTTTKYTDDSCHFQLTATQTAYFDIPENYKVNVKEITSALPDTTIYGYEWINNYVILEKDGKVQEKTEITLQKGESYRYNFVNIYDPLYGNLIITKAGISASDYADSADQQSNVFRIEGESITGEVISLELVLVGNESKVIKDLPVGNYKVTEITDWSWRYTLQEITIEKDQSATSDLENKKISFKLTSQGEHVTFTNARDNDNWLSGDTHCRNWWGNNGNVKKTSVTSQND